MAKDTQDIVKDVLSRIVEDASKGVGNGKEKLTDGGLGGMRGIAAGAGVAALAPLAAKGVGKLVQGGGPEGLASRVGDRLSGGIGDAISDKVENAGGPGGMLKDAIKGALPFGDDEDDKQSGNDVPGVGKGRRMPVQQSVDIGLPIETVYNQWTQFEQWPNFMHRVTRVTQEDDCTVSFATKIWGKTKEFKAEIQTQRPNERIKWRVSEGMTHTGVVTFHELGPNLTRVMLGFDIDPGSLLEKFARGARHVKRAARGDLHRFKAYIEMAEHETGAWRGRIEDGEVVEKHKASYDRGREYTDFEDVVNDSGESENGGGSRRQSGGRASSGRSSSRSSSSGRSSGSRSSASNSRSSGSSSRSSGSSSRASGNGSSASRGRSGGSSRQSANHAEGRSRSRGRS